MPRPALVAALQQLLEQCRVLVDGLRQGSGFFVAPGFVLSCAHVAGERGDRLRIRWRDREHEAVVRAASEAPGGVGGVMWPYPDLAVLEVIDPPADHPCVLLDGQRPWDGTTVTVAGFTSLLEHHAAAPRRARLTVVGDSFYQQGPLLELGGHEINPGLSGGAVLSHVSGGVCAVVKATRQEDTAMGGYATPVEALRLLDPGVYARVMTAHDRFHEADSRWTRLSDLVEEAEDEASLLLAPGARLTQAESRLFRCLLADVSESRPAEPSSHDAAFLAAAPPGTPLPDLPLLTRRDVFGALAALNFPEPGELPYELAYGADVARETTTCPPGEAALRHLRNQVLLAAGRLGLGTQALRRLRDDPSGAGLPSVIGRLRHSLRDRNLYQVMAWRYHSPQEIVPAAPESDALALPEALDRLAGLLTEQIDLMGGVGRPGLVELILPHEVLDEDFADWRLWPTSAYSTLGRKQYVVVRPLERHEAPALHHAWQQRWSELATKPVGEVLVCVCGRGRQRQETLDATFNNDPALAALALAGSPRSDPVAQAYQVAVASGVPMMLWPRGAAPAPLPHDHRCGIPGRDGCPGSEFFAQARRRIGDTRRDALPQRICALRNAALTDEDDEGTSHIGERVVLLWDDPTRQIPRTPLAPAPPFQEGRPR